MTCRKATGALKLIHDIFGKDPAGLKTYLREFDDAINTNRDLKNYISKVTPAPCCTPRVGSSRTLELCCTACQIDGQAQASSRQQQWLASKHAQVQISNDLNPLKVWGNAASTPDIANSDLPPHVACRSSDPSA